MCNLSFAKNRRQIFWAKKPCKNFDEMDPSRQKRGLDKGNVPKRGMKFNSKQEAGKMNS
jgi:hypothetical protein